MNAKCHVWRKPDTIMLWGCFPVAGTGRLVRMESKINRKYRLILDEPAPEHTGPQTGGRRFTFQHNDPKHTAKTTQELLRDKSLSLSGPARART
uniref:Uncharacterized protein n=1 Tax=Oncorhynchus tshawytscha TaxID=74940 RepID=A0AAZ3R6Y0_ONCTS